MRIFRQIVKGCGALPYVGEHPGTGPFAALVLIIGAAGAQRGGWLGLVVGATLALAVFGPMFLYGAYSRANLSDRMRRDYD